MASYTPSEYHSTPSSGFAPLHYDPMTSSSALSGYLGGLRLSDAGLEEGSLAAGSSAETEVCPFFAAPSARVSERRSGVYS